MLKSCERKSLKNNKIKPLDKKPAEIQNNNEKKTQEIINKFLNKKVN